MARSAALLFFFFAIATCLPHDHKTSEAPREGKHVSDFDFTEEGPTIRDRKVCGVRRNNIPDVFTRIVGGSQTLRHEFPWQVSIRWHYRGQSQHLCGATVLSSIWVVTAAHCTHQFRVEQLTTIAGDHNVHQTERSEQHRGIRELHEHYGYDPTTQRHDIALLRVDKPFHIDGYTVLPACLPRPRMAFTEKDNCVVTGWGKQRENGKDASILRKVVVPIINRNQCKGNYEAIGYNGPISEQMMCAGYPTGKMDACQGDSGGPLVCRGLDNHYVLTGIVSWGVGCARPNVPGVYTEVRRYIKWMSDVVSGQRSWAERAVTGSETSMHFDDALNSTQTVEEELTGQMKEERVADDMLGKLEEATQGALRMMGKARMLDHGEEGEDLPTSTEDHHEADQELLIDEQDDAELKQMLENYVDAGDEKNAEGSDAQDHSGFPPSIFGAHKQELDATGSFW